MNNDDVIIAVGDEDVRWKSQNYVNELILRNSSNLTLRLVSVLGSISVASPVRRQFGCFSENI